MYCLDVLYCLYWPAGLDSISVFAVSLYHWIYLDIAVSLDISRTGTGSYRIIMAGCKDGTNGTDVTDGNDGLDGELVGLGWTVISTRRNGSNRTGAPPLAGWLLKTRANWDRWN